MTFAPFWAGGLLLAAVTIGHFLLTGRHLGVSGRIGALVDRLRPKRRDAEAPAMTEDELVAAVRAMTVEEFGCGAVVEPAPADPVRPATAPPHHVLFFVGLALGGLAAALASGAAIAPGLASEGFATAFGGGPGTFALLFAGGILVGFGTRMAGGCTSGHGLVGVSSFRPGSLVATACFFGAGIAASFAIEAIR